MAKDEQASFRHHATSSQGHGRTEAKAFLDTRIQQLQRVQLLISIMSAQLLVQVLLEALVPCQLIVDERESRRCCFGRCEYYKIQTSAEVIPNP